MNAQELNRDILRLHRKLIKSGKDMTPDDEKEYMRLYWADINFKYATKRTLLIMLRLNLRHRIIAFHTFGINIKLEEL